MLTVCLAPLVTHICFGFAEPVILADRRPRVSDRLVQFNPITIVWRWYAIVNRRIRAKSWDRADMAATNAIFWDGHRWDGSEEMMLKSRAWVTKLPEHTRVNWISSSTLATAAMTLQGVDALLHLIHSTKVDWNAATDGLPNIFYPVAILSLSRLPASIWLSNEYGYEKACWNEQHLHDQPSEGNGPQQSLLSSTIPKLALDEAVQEHRQSLEYSGVTTVSRLKPNTAFCARLWALCGILCSFGCCGGVAYVCIVDVSRRPFVIVASCSSLMTVCYYFVLNVSACLIFISYILKGQAGSTAIPCMNSGWYKALNIFMILLAIAMFVTSALETTIPPNGQATTYSLPPP